MFRRRDCSADISRPNALLVGGAFEEAVLFEFASQCLVRSPQIQVLPRESVGLFERRIWMCLSKLFPKEEDEWANINNLKWSKGYFFQGTILEITSKWNRKFIFICSEKKNFALKIVQKWILYSEHLKDFVFKYILLEIQVFSTISHPYI